MRMPGKSGGLLAGALGGRSAERPRDRRRNLKTIPDYFRLREPGRESGGIDDRTWRDLDMDEVFARLDKTLTAPGQQVLYDLLRRPCLDADALAQRRSLLAASRGEPDRSARLCAILALLGARGGDYLAWYLWAPPPEPKLGALPYRLATAAMLLIPFAIAVSPSMGLFLAIALYVLNMGLHFRIKRLIWHEIDSTIYLGRLLRTAGRLARLNAGEEGPFAVCRRAAAATRRLRRKLAVSAALGSNTADDLLSIVKVFTLVEARAYFAARRLIDAQRNLLQELYTAVGLLDAGQAVAAWRESLLAWCEPEFGARDELVAAGIYHPLLAAAVPNDVLLTPPGLVVTGSNMSGKSTFLKTIGVGALLAQTVLTVPAVSYRSRPWRIISAIGRTDNLIEGKSYYLDEAQAVLRAVRAAESGPCLLLMDELFRGTNSRERVAAAAAVMEYLARRSACTILATHDMEIPELLRYSYQNGHFREAVGREGLVFEYKLQEGPARSSNALKVLRYVGFPDEIVGKAEGTITSR